MTSKEPHSVSSMLLLVMVEDPASDLHPILFNVSPSKYKLVLVAQHLAG